MAHDLFNNEAYAGRKPAWHALGVVLPDATTMTELAGAAGISWEYTKADIFFEVETLTDTWHHKVPDKAVVLKDGLTPMGIVSSEYEFLQPRAIQESVDRILAGTSWLPETALALGQGETTVYCVSLGGWSIDNDRVEDYLVITDTVDGKHALTAAITPVRTVCRNTLRLGLRNAQVRLNLVHKAGHVLNYYAMVDTIIKSQNSLREALTNLSKITLTQERMQELYKELFPLPPTLETAKDHAIAVRMSELQQTSMGYARKMVEREQIASTGWAWFNGASEAIEHGNLMPALSTRKSLVLGTGAATEYLTRAYELVTLKGA